MTVLKWVYTCSAQGGQKEAWNALELVLQASVSHHMKVLRYEHSK